MVVQREREGDRRRESEIEGEREREIVEFTLKFHCVYIYGAQNTFDSIQFCFSLFSLSSLKCAFVHWTGSDKYFACKSKDIESFNPKCFKLYRDRFLVICRLDVVVLLEYAIYV